MGRRKRDDDEEEAYREDEDLSVLIYNQALLCLQLRQYAQATLILEELFENIEPIDDFLAIKSASCCSNCASSRGSRSRLSQSSHIWRSRTRSSPCCAASCQRGTSPAAMLTMVARRAMAMLPSTPTR